MKLTRDQYETIYDRLMYDFRDLDNSTFGIKVNAGFVKEEQWIRYYGKVNLGYFASTFYHKIHCQSYDTYLLNMINRTKEIIEAARQKYHPAEDDQDIINILRKVDQIEAEYREIHKTLQDNDVIAALKEIKQQQNEVLDQLKKLSTKQLQLEAAVIEVNKRPVPTIHASASIPGFLTSDIRDIKKQIETLQEDVKGINEIKKMLEPKQHKKSFLHR